MRAIWFLPDGRSFADIPRQIVQGTDMKRPVVCTVQQQFSAPVTHGRDGHYVQTGQGSKRTRHADLGPLLRTATAKEIDEPHPSGPQNSDARRRLLQTIVTTTVFRKTETSSLHLTAAGFPAELHHQFMDHSQSRDTNGMSL